MRITNSEMYRNFLSDIQTLNERLNNAGRQLSSGKKLTYLKDSPSGSAELISLSERASEIEQYKSNIDTGMYFLRVAESALNEVHNLVASIYAKGSQAASEVLASEARVTLADEIRSYRDQILAIANSRARERYIFAGSRVMDAPFTISGDTVSYGGDEEASSVRVDDGTEVQQCISASGMFASIFGAIEELLNAIDEDDLPDIKTALEQFSSALSGLNQVRGRVGVNLGTLESIKTALEMRTLSVKERQSLIEDADLSEVVVRLQKNQTALEAAMTAGGSILRQYNLFDIIG